MIPDNWRLVTLDSISNLYTGNSINEKIKQEKYTGIPHGITYISTKDISFDNVIDYDTNVKIPESAGFKIAPANTTLLCIEGGSAGRKIGFTSQSVCFVNKLCAFVAVNINSKYIYYFLQTLDFINQFNDKKHGLIGGVSIKELSSIKIPVPPINEQKRIVDIIESLFSKLDRAKALAQNIIDNYELRRSAILNKVLNYYSGQEVILSDVCKINPSKIYTKDLSDNIEVSFISMSSVSAELGTIIESKTRQLKEVKKGFTNFSEGDVIFAKITPCMENGKSAVVGKLTNDIGYGSTEFYILRCNEDLYNRFIYHLIRSKKFRNEAKKVMTGSVGQLRVPKNFLENYILKLPTIEEQKEIVRILDNLLSKEQRTKELAEQVINEVDLLKKSILARAFRGEL